MSKEIKVVVSGSFRKHLRQIGTVLKDFKKSGVKILAPLDYEALNGNDNFVFITTDDPGEPADILGKEFMANIEKADFLYLANVGGYVGQSVATEMGVAIMNNVPVVVSEDIKVFSDEIPKREQELLKKFVFRQLSISKISSEKITELSLASFTPTNLFPNEMKLLQSLVQKLLESLKFVKMTK